MNATNGVRAWPRRKIVNSRDMGSTRYSKSSSYEVTLECGHIEYIKASAIGQKTMHCRECHLKRDAGQGEREA